MKIVHLSTGHLGGAGLAARRLNAGLRAARVDSTFFALESLTYSPKMGEFELKRTPIQSVKAGVTTLATNIITGDSLVTPFSSHIIDKSFLHSLSGGNDTIFHIHNWFNIFNQAQLAELSREFNFVVTLHDQRLFTGACHYSFECQNFQSDCMHCPQLPKILQIFPPRNLAKAGDFSNVRFITPSNWLMGLATASRLFRNSTGAVIPNSFYGYASRFTVSNRTDPTINVGLAAMNPKAWIKGGDLISSLMIKNGATSNFRFFSLSDFDNYMDFWANIDVLLVPSQADNSPNVIHESKLWGIPVVTTDAGGIPELITHGFDGLIPLQELSVDRIESELIAKELRKKELTEREAVAANHRLSLNKSVPEHVNFYRSLLFE